MYNWQSLDIQIRIGFHAIGDTQRLMSDTPSDIDRLNSFDSGTITEIHNRFFPDIFRFARFRINDEVLAEDIAAEVFVRLLDAVHQGRGPNANLQGWLFKTAANIVNDYYRKMYQHPQEELADSLENHRDLFIAEADPAEVTDLAEQAKQIRSIIMKLTKEQKLVITLRFGNKFTLEETARIMGKNINSVKALQFRALMTLRKQLGEDIA